MIQRGNNRKVILQMNKLPDWFFLALSTLIMLLVLATSDLSISESFVVAYFIFTFLRFVNNFGNTICIFDFLTFYSALDTLLAALISYKFFDKNDHLAFIWGKYMRVSEDVYFDYMIPANIALFVGVHMFFRTNNARSALVYLERAKQFVSDKLRVGIVFVVVGFTAGLFLNIIPGSFTYFFYLLSMLSYVGGLYIYFSLKRNRSLIISIMVVAFFAEAAETGMFGEFFMFIILAACLIISQYKFSFLSKFAIFTLGITFVLILQNVKLEYRSLTWANGKERSLEYRDKGNLEIFSDLFVDRIFNTDAIITKRSLFFINTRFNQGWLISLAMDYVPRVEPFANGETIGLSLAAVAVPRFLWRDKPEAGGYMNLSRFVGIKKKLSYSMNIGPYGEGYGNFGTAGGVVFIFVFGLSLAYFLHKTLDISKTHPSVIIWIQLLFYYVLTVETDILTTINSFVKSALFMYIIYWFAQKAYRLKI
jgi:hypothetical protein